MAAIDESLMPPIRQAINEAVAKKEIPGAVLWIERGGASRWEAFGNRMIDPRTEPMTKDVIFDAASLTKVLATAPSIMLLVQDRKLKLDTLVSSLIPEFTGGGKELVTVRHLLTHTSGTRSGIPKERIWAGYNEGVIAAATELLQSAPGAQFRYSDINFILLGEIVRKVSGSRVDQFAAARLFRPLGMADTSYKPSRGKLGRLAPTTREPGGLVHGVVHDPTSRRMDGVAGHAGLFTTAKDVAIFCRMMLNGGKSAAGRQILTAATLKLMTQPVALPLGVRRGLGWDVWSRYSDIKGAVFGATSYGHTGWTGTAFWIDPETRSFVVLLANRNHPTEAGSTRELRAKVSTLAAEAMGLRKKTTTSLPRRTGIAGPEGRRRLAGGVSNRLGDQSFQKPREGRHLDASEAAWFRPCRGSDSFVNLTGGSRHRLISASPPGFQRPMRLCRVRNGIDVLEANGFAALQGLRVGLVTNHTGLSRSGKTTIDLLAAAPGVKLVSLFSPEHGIRGTEDRDGIADSVDAATGLPVHSLYGKTRRPLPAQLANVDALVFDIQDIGCRFYTYISTMLECMKAASEEGRRFIVLDRINPIDGVTVDGPLPQGKLSFVACHSIPLRHGMTIGELAKMFVAENKLKLELTVVPVEGWDRRRDMDGSGVKWVNPSPNMRSLDAATLYPGVALIEFCNVSVGRGTESPFLLVGAPWIDGEKLAAAMEAEKLPGLKIAAAEFTPVASVFKGEPCRGIKFTVKDRKDIQSVRTGIALATAIQRLHGAQFKIDPMQKLLFHPAALSSMRSGKPVGETMALWAADFPRFQRRRAVALLYPES